MKENQNAQANVFGAPMVSDDINREQRELEEAESRLEAQRFLLEDAPLLRRPRRDAVQLVRGALDDDSLVMEDVLRMYLPVELESPRRLIHELCDLAARMSMIAEDEARLNRLLDDFLSESEDSEASS